MPGPTADLFADDALQQPAGRDQIGEQSYVLKGYALPWIERLLPELRQVLAQSPFRQMVTPGGFTMSAALSSCGDLGWITDFSCGAAALATVLRQAYWLDVDEEIGRASCRERV